MRHQAACLAILFLLALLSCTVVSNAHAQYMFLDSNGDSTSLDDALESLNTPTTVSVWIVTNQMRDTSPASCPSASDSLTINSYEVILHAAGGQVTYSNLVNHVSEMSTQFGFASDSTDLYVGFGGGTALPPGKYLLCTLEITGVSGNPNIEIATTTPLSGAYLTSFGSRCPGTDSDNTLKLGTDWSDADGLLGIDGLSISLNISEETTLSIGSPITIDASVDGAGDGLTLEAASVPYGATTSFAPDGKSASVHWVPLTGDAGSHTVTFRAYTESDSTERSAEITVPSSGVTHSMRVSPSIRYLAEVGPNSGEPLINEVDGEEQVDVFLESALSDEDLGALGVTVHSRFDDHMTAACLRDSLSSLLLSTEIDAILAPPLCELALDYSAVSAGVDGLRTHSNGSLIQGSAGQGVIVGIVDTGIDVSHPDFKNADGTSRLLAYWDQMGCGGCPGIPGSSPAVPYDFGREWIPAASESLFYLRAGTYSRDTVGHGTWVAGVAAGNANYEVNAACSSRRYMGVAPRADIIAVKLHPLALLDDRYPSSRIVDAVNYIVAKAKALNKRAVINLSLGSQYGPHDGRGWLDGLFSSSLYSAGPGYIVVASTGNDAQDNLHGVAFAGDGNVAKRRVTFEVPPHEAVGGGGHDTVEVYAWFDRDDSLAVKVVSPNTYSLGPIGMASESSSGTGLANTDDGIISVDINDQIESEYSPFTFPPFGARIVVRAKPGDKLEPGPWTLEFTALTDAASIGGDGRVDAYITRRGVGDPVNFVGIIGQPTISDEAIRMPATADSVIAVGAYVSNPCYQDSIGNVNCASVGARMEDTYWPSSHGPRRDGVMKPDIVAPGAVIVAARSKHAAFGDPLRVRGGGYVALHGTSGAAPHVAGAVALLLMEAAHTPSSARQRLQASAVRFDPFMSTTPNKVWGWGKLNTRKAVADTTFSLEVLVPRPGYSFPGYPFHAGVQESVVVRVTGAGTDANGVSIELVPVKWCYFPDTLLGTTPQLAANQSYVFRFTLPTSFSEDSVRVRATASAGILKGRSAWTRYQHRVVVGSPTGIEEGAEAQVAHLRLRLGTANPAGSGFGFRAAVPQAGEITLKVFSVSGRLVWERKAVLQAPGQFAFVWDGTDKAGRRVGSGVYFLQATAGRERLLKKLVVMK